MSCRVLGRGVEEAMLHVLVERARSLELGELEAELIPTDRNAPLRTFLEERSRLRRDGERRFAWDLGTTYIPPPYVRVEMRE
jgi:predicted enzyme involved in methoxymalonyl-ACP biosynthesis